MQPLGQVDHPNLRHAGWVDRVPPSSFFLVSAVFHYLGPSFAVLLFARVDVLGVAWLRIASAAAIFALWRRPWRVALRMSARERWLLLELGVVLAAMNSFFYLAVDRLPLSTVGAIEFMGTVFVAAIGAKTPRNAAALTLTTLGVVTITSIRIAGAPVAFLFAFANGALFMLYVVLGHRMANVATGSTASGIEAVSSIDRLGASIIVAAVVVTPFGLGAALPAVSRAELLLAGVAVGVCSSVIPYVTDQLAMSRMPRATFALMLALLPMFATIIGTIVLHQLPTVLDLAGIASVVAGIALHQIPQSG
jgi:inner membrane transporter RhtA